jgi:hypothetical protein
LREAEFPCLLKKKKKKAESKTAPATRNWNQLLIFECGNMDKITGHTQHSVALSRTFFFVFRMTHTDRHHTD